MAIGLKMDFDLKGSGDQRATLGELRRFVNRAEAGGCEDHEELMLEFDERDELTGFSLWLNPDT